MNIKTSDVVRGPPNVLPLVFILQPLPQRGEVVQQSIRFEFPLTSELLHDVRPWFACPKFQYGSTNQIFEISNQVVPEVRLFITCARFVRVRGWGGV